MRYPSGADYAPSCSGHRPLPSRMPPSGERVDRLTRSAMYCPVFFAQSAALFSTTPYSALCPITALPVENLARKSRKCIWRISTPSPHRLIS
jgi:hypothetical protein